MTITVREKGKTLEQSGGLVLTVGHVDGAEDRGHEGDDRLRHRATRRSCTAR